MMKSIWLFFPFLNFAVKKELEFRFNLVFFVFFDLLWITISLISVVLIFRQAGTIAGWTQSEAILIILVYYLSGSIIKTFIVPAAEELSDLIRLGKLDLFLLKPAAVKPLVMFSSMYLHELVRFFLMLGVLPWYLRQIQLEVSLAQWLIFAAISALSVIGFAGIYFAVAATSFWFQNTYNLGDFFRETLDVSKRPIDIFPGIFRQFITFVIPLGLVASVPTQVLLGKASNSILIWSAIGTAAISLFSHAFFQFSLRRYSSASS